jgi:O-antigen/teichoic acid export membrane protein
VLANSIYSLLSQVSSGVFTAIITLYLTRSLGPGRYGVFALAVGVGGFVATPSDFGISGSTARFVADHRDDPGRVAAFLADAVRMKVVMSLLACGALFALAGPIAAAYHAPLLWPLRLTAAAVFGQNMMFLFEASFISVAEIGSWVRVAMGESVVECTSSIVLVALGGGVVGASVGRAIGYVTGGLLGLALGARRFGWQRKLRRRGRPAETRRIARFAGPLMLVDGANALFATIDILLIGAYLGSRSAGLFSAPTRLLVVFWYPGVAVANGVAPRLSRGGEGDGGRSLAGGLRVLLLIYSAMLGPIIVWAPAIIRILLGGSYGGSVATTRWLSGAILLGGMAPLVSTAANYLGDARSRVLLMVGATLLDGLIDVILIPRIGIISGAIATAIAYAVMFYGHIRICERHIVIPRRQLCLTALRCLLAAAAAAGICLLWGTDPDVLSLIVGAIACAVVFGVVLLVVGEFNKAEVSGAVAAIRGRIPRTSRR